MNRISLYNLNTDNTITFPEKPDTVFTLTGEIGRGASCIVYHAVCADNTEHLLKEYYPKHLDLTRDHAGNITPSESDTCAYEEGMKRFRSGCEQQKNIRLYEDGLKNYTSNIQGCYKANGTEYIDMTCFSGRTYDHVHEKSVYDLLRRMKTLTQVIGKYHDAGLLHLDIKPENIYVRPEEETVEDVMLFDFDSVVSMQEAATGEKPLSCTKTWAAPEQLLPRKRKMISPATDLFAIGEIVFYQLFGRHSEASERRSYVCTYPYDRNAEIFKNMNPKVFTLLDAFFCHTIHSDISERYQTAADMMESLDKMISLADPKEPYLVSSLPVPKDFFIGRDAEIADIHAKLQQNPVLFLHGIGGIGKSELAKQYAVKYREEYDTVIFAPYVSDIVSMIADDNYVQIHYFSRLHKEKAEEYYERKVRKLKSLVNGNGDRTLMIVDNLDAAEDSNTKILLEFGCRVLVTTRVNFKDYGYPQKDIEAFSDPAVARQIFEYYYNGTLTEEESHDIDAIITLVQGHTLAVELIAKQVEAEWSTIAEIRTRLEQGGLASIGDESVDSEKDGNFTSASVFGHIKALFDLSLFEKEGKENELYVLANLALIPYTGIERKLFAEWCELDKHGGKTVVNDLIKNGWVQCNRDVISMHPVIAEIVIVQCVYTTPVLCQNMLQTILFNWEDIQYLTPILVGIGKNLVKASIVTIDTANFLTNVGLNIEGPYTDWHFDVSSSFLQRANKIFSKLCGNCHINTACSLNNLGVLYYDAGQLEIAKRYFVKSYEIKKYLLGKNHLMTARTLFNLGATSKVQKEYDVSIKNYEEVLTIFRNIFSDNHVAVAQQTEWIALVYEKMQNYDSAIMLLENALQLYQNIYRDENNFESMNIKYILHHIVKAKSNTETMWVWMPDTPYKEHIIYSKDKDFHFDDLSYKNKHPYTNAAIVEELSLYYLDFTDADDMDDALDFSEIDS